MLQGCLLLVRVSIFGEKTTMFKLQLPNEYDFLQKHHCPFLSHYPVKSCCCYKNNEMLDTHNLVWFHCSGRQVIGLYMTPTRALILRGWQRVFAWSVMAPKFAVWRVIKPKLSAWRGTAHNKLMRDLLLYKCVMRDLYDFLLEFRDKGTPFDLEGYQSLKVNRVLTKINKPWQPCHYFLVFSVLCWPMLGLWFLWSSW